jgi:hypothetical protein
LQDAVNDQAGREKLKIVRLVFFLYVLTIILLILKTAPMKSMCQDDNADVWYVHDVIDPSLDEVKWREIGAIEGAPTWISDGRWFQASIRQSLISSSDIFVSTYELFNWSRVSLSLRNNLDITFDSFYDFADNLTISPSWWLSYSWGIDTEWYGITSNQTRVSCSLNNSTSSEAELSIWFHISRIAEYLVGEKNVESWLTGFDLTPVSIGSLKTWELYEDSTRNGTHYNLFFRAPANILSQHRENYTLQIDVSSNYQGALFKIQQVIDINMPPETEIKQTSPSSMAVVQGNTASFVIARGDMYPASFTVISGPPTKSMTQVAWENVSVWLLTPAGWAAIATLTVLSFTGLRGRRLLSRNSRYHRLFKSMVTIYDLYSKDFIKFQQEMENISRSIIRLLVEDKISDDQFEKLLQRRDDLLSRAHQK